MGPDEFHEKVPGSDAHGLKDNAYTNIMVVWLLEKALEVLEHQGWELLDGNLELLGTCIGGTGQGTGVKEEKNK